MSSVQCPASIILKAHDIAQAWSKSDLTIIGGFHAPVEKEMLRILLRGQGKLVICAARQIHNMRLPKDWQMAIEANRLLLLFPFAENQKRATKQTSQVRNHLFTAFADQVLIIHASPCGKTEALAKSLVYTTISVCTIADGYNQYLVDMESKQLQNRLLKKFKQIPLSKIRSPAVLMRQQSHNQKHQMKHRRSKIADTMARWISILNGLIVK